MIELTEGLIALTGYIGRWWDGHAIGPLVVHAAVGRRLPCRRILVALVRLVADHARGLRALFRHPVPYHRLSLCAIGGIVLRGRGHGARHRARGRDRAAAAERSPSPSRARAGEAGQCPPVAYAAR